VLGHPARGGSSNAKCYNEADERVELRSEGVLEDPRAGGTGSSVEASGPRKPSLPASDDGIAVVLSTVRIDGCRHSRQSESNTHLLSVNELLVDESFLEAPSSKHFIYYKLATGGVEWSVRVVPLGARRGGTRHGVGSGNE